jgi:SAM-dependent methyltransferase
MIKPSSGLAAAHDENSGVRPTMIRKAEEKTDLTRDYDYERLIEEEKEHYSAIDVTDDLKEGGSHASGCWRYYWEHVGEIIAESYLVDFAEIVNREFVGTTYPLNILSLGSGFCGHELGLTQNLTVPHLIECTDINEAIFEQAKKVAQEEDLALEFREEDLNFIELAPGRYDVIFAHAVIHHVINLERLFEQLRAGLSDRGIFHMVDVVGQNRRLIWDENEDFANALLDLVPQELIGTTRLDIPFDADGMEGIRQDDIVPLLRETFEPVHEQRHGAFMRFICTNAELGPRLDPSRPDAKAWLDLLIKADDVAVMTGLLRPLEIWGVYKARKNAK